MMTPNQSIYSPYISPQLSQKRQHIQQGIIFHAIMNQEEKPENILTQRAILENFLANFIHPAKVDITEKESPLDHCQFTIAEGINDEKLEIFNALMGYNLMYSTEQSFEKEGLPKFSSFLNDVQELFLAHYQSRKNVIEIFQKDFMPRQKNGKFYFSNKEEYLSFISYTSRHLDTNNEVKTRVQRTIHCAFMKMAYILSHLNTFEVIKKKREIFEHIVDNIINKNFSSPDPHLIKKIGNGHNTQFTIQYLSQIPGGDIAPLHITGRVKTIFSIAHKMGRDEKYGDFGTLKDLFGFQIECSHPLQLLQAMAFFYQYIITSCHEYIEAQKRDSDKGIIISNKHIFHDIPTPMQDKILSFITQYPNESVKKVLQYLIAEQTITNPNVSSKYQDVKLLIPLFIDGDNTYIEVKFVLKGNQNEELFSSHEILEIKKKITQRSREMRFLTDLEIRNIIIEQVSPNPYLCYQLGGGDQEQLINNIFSHLLDTQNIIIKQISTVDEPLLKSIIKHLFEEMELNGHLSECDFSKAKKIKSQKIRKLFGELTEIEMEKAKEDIIGLIHDIYAHSLHIGHYSIAHSKEILKNGFNELISYFISCHIDKHLTTIQEKD